MSIWEELKEKGYNPTMKIVYPKFVTTITVTSDIEHIGGDPLVAAHEAQAWIKEKLDNKEKVEFNFHTYSVDETESEDYGEEMYLFPPLVTGMNYGE